jgi:hypothetical protein
MPSYSTQVIPAEIQCKNCGKVFQSKSGKALQLMARLHKQKEHNGEKVNFIEVKTDFTLFNKRNGIDKGKNTIRRELYEGKII